MNQNERKEKIEEYGRGYDLFNAALNQIPHEAWEFKPAPGEWSIHETIIHMADSESIGALRLRKMIAEPGSTLMTYEEAKWAETLNYQNQNADDALQIFKLTRQTIYRLLQTIPDQVFMQSAVHPEYVEPYTFENWLDTYTRHVSEHLGQLEKIYQAQK
ncbi:MAG: DinB family protein [Anaerolineales bacterium]